MDARRRRLLTMLPALWAAGRPLAAPPTELEKAARAEGRIVSAGMPDFWANWRETWSDMQHLHGLLHEDFNTSSAEAIARLQNEGRQATLDIVDVGYEFAAQAKALGLTRAHKPAVWEQIPDWAKDAEGHWALAYTGTIAFVVNTRGVTKVPHSWKQLFEDRQLRVMPGEVGPTAQANAVLLAAAIALGGSETRLDPAVARFADVAARGRLNPINVGVGRMKANLADVYLMWDFNALSFRHRLANAADFEILIPADGSVMSGYAPLLNRYAPRPNAAQLVREYIFSDAGQLNLARGNARPIRIDQIELPEAVRRRLVDSAQYRNARALQPQLWARESKKLGPVWQKEVLRQPATLP
ncbi:extracellular solute-binding protein [Pelomonas sp. SE-A7]|uniref:ABC transporter substrate-binding protein n=1 Tax=Pelomonas sp. SE-A7 TaxID=3054953 RepID=UPI00259C825E|nr:extracellular solute-binding protein [Pelomonas sp. SE-A7]MDM4768522.1 ABC transporter substrate-binding protein [Pelomonas sp. SE-A7]